MVVNIAHNKEKQKRKDYSKGNKKHIFLSLFLISLLTISGCINLENSFFTSKTTYEQEPIQITYEINYGYQINITGNGSATVTYQEYLPQTPNGEVYFESINPIEQNEKITDNNHKIFWNQSLGNTINQSYTINAHIIQNPIITSDLTGKKSLTLQQIKTMHPAIYNTYCKKMGNQTTTFIDPTNPRINSIGQQILSSTNTQNAFLLGKQVFSWLKNNTMYQKHKTYQPQPAITTYNSGMGDCDDLTYLYLSICRSIGLPSRYIKGYLISNDSAIPHVWAEIFVGTQISQTGWIPVECAGTGKTSSEIHNHYGLEDVHHLRLYTDDGTNETFQQLNNPLSVKYNENMDINITRIETVENYATTTSAQLTIEENTRKYQ
jgi:hypothetical protein